MIDTVHEHECLIYFFGFNVQFVSNLTYLYSYILPSCMVVSFACRFYLCHKHCVINLFVDAVQQSFSEATRSSIRENCRYAFTFAPDRMETGRRSLSPIKNVIDTL